jgi:hypothetical protein
MRTIRPAATKRSAIQAVYDAVEAPAWAAPNLDGLADVLRDLSWLPLGPVDLRWPAMPDLDQDDAERIRGVLNRAQTETAGTARPVSVQIAGG